MQLLAGAGGCKAGRDGVAQAVHAVPAADQVFGLAQAQSRVGVAQAVRAVAVLQHLAGDHAQMALLRFGHEGIHRLGVGGSKTQGRGHAVAHQLVQKKRTDFVRVDRVGKLFFMRKGVVLQPRQQAVGGRADHIGLGVVDVQIHKAGCDAQARPVGGGQIGVLLSQFAVGANGLDAHDAVGFKCGHQQAVAFVASLWLARVGKPEQPRTPALKIGMGSHR